MKSSMHEPEHPVTRVRVPPTSAVRWAVLLLAVIACTGGPAAAAAAADTLAVTAAPNRFGEGTRTTLNFSGTAGPGSAVLLGISQLSHPCATDVHSFPSQDWLVGGIDGDNYSAAEIPVAAGAFSGQYADVAAFPNKGLSVLPDRIGAPPGSYLVCAYVVMLAGTGSDTTTATASTVLSIRAARDYIKIQARNLRNGHGALTVHYHVEPGTYSRDRSLRIFQDICDGTPCESHQNRLTDDLYPLHVRPPDANGNGVATLTYGTYYDGWATGFVHLYKGDVIRCWLHSYESLSSVAGNVGATSPSNALAVATFTFRR